MTIALAHDILNTRDHFVVAGEPRRHPLAIRIGVPQVQGRPVAAYLEQLAATRARTLEVLRGFGDADLARQVGEAEPPAGDGAA